MMARSGRPGLGVEHGTAGGRQPADEPARAVGRFASLEGYRGLAALFILVYHVYQYMRAGPLARYPLEGTAWHAFLVGLDSFVGLFFVLSAFLLGLPFARAALGRTQTVSARAFLYRRAVRIVPLYLVAVLVAWAARNRTLPGDWLDLLEHLTFTQVFDNKRIFYTIGPAWSLAVEVQFYLLLLPLGAAACAICRRIDSARWRVAALLGAVAGLGAVGLVWKTIAWYAVGVGERNWSVWFSLPAKIDVFAVGLLLAVVVAARPERAYARLGPRAGLAGAGLLVLVAAFAVNGTDRLPDPFFHSVTAVGYGLLVAAAVLAPADGGGRILASAVAVGLGMISYSLYLWHEPVMLLLADRGMFPAPGARSGFPLGVLVLAAVAIPVAWLSYWIIEYPVGSLRRSRDHRGKARDYYADRALSQDYVERGPSQPRRPTATRRFR
ncbi:MAG TPA: acyltransferase [Pilimelia sp.]|nr:acyltransferase [Pilimelia sp.]